MKLILIDTEFNQWKTTIEHQTVAFFNSTASRDGGKFKYFECNRSGFSDQKNQGKSNEKKTRQLKSQRSCKIGRHCPMDNVHPISSTEQLLPMKSQFRSHPLTIDTQWILDTSLLLR